MVFIHSGDTYLWEKSIETVDLLFFLHEGIILCHSLESQFIHQVDLIWVIQMLSLFEKKDNILL